MAKAYENLSLKSKRNSSSDITTMCGPKGSHIFIINIFYALRSNKMDILPYFWYSHARFPDTKEIAK